MINLGRTQRSQDRLRAELDTLGTDLETVAQFVRREDTFLHKTYLEILRNNPPICTFPALIKPCRVLLTEIGFSLPETTAVEKRIAGYLIPAGTIVIMDTQRLNKTSPVWGTDGDVFRPERWDTITTQQARYSFLGYGMGPRKCLGKNVANVIIKLFLVAIVQRFELQAGTGATQIKRDRFTCMPEEMVSFRPRA